jgi:creatinine amidohydrolase
MPSEAHPTPPILRWETLTKRAFDELDPARCVVLVTCSPLEVHGPHLPFGADALEGEGLVERTLRFLPDRHRTRTFLKLPFSYAATDVVPQRGSLFFRPSTTRAFLEDLGNTLAAQGFRDILVSNFHGGVRHFVALEQACDRVSRRRGVRMVSVFSLMLARLSGKDGNLEDLIASIPGVRREDLKGDTHGGILETSQLLALCGGWVDPVYKELPQSSYESWVAKAQGGRSDLPKGRLAGFAAMIRSYRGNVRYFLDNSYSGAPAGASAEIGERILDALGGKTAEAVTEILDGALSPNRCHSPLWPFRFFLQNPWMIRLSDRLLGFPNPIA